MAEDLTKVGRGQVGIGPDLDMLKAARRCRRCHECLPASLWSFFRATLIILLHEGKNDTRTLRILSIATVHSKRAALPRINTGRPTDDARKE